MSRQLLIDLPFEKASTTGFSLQHDTQVILRTEGRIDKQAVATLQLELWLTPRATGLEEMIACAELVAEDSNISAWAAAILWLPAGDYDIKGRWASDRQLQTHEIKVPEYEFRQDYDKDPFSIKTMGNGGPVFTTVSFHQERKIKPQAAYSARVTNGFIKCWVDGESARDPLEGNKGGTYTLTVDCRPAARTVKNRTVIRGHGDNGEGKLMSLVVLGGI